MTDKFTPDDFLLSESELQLLATLTEDGFPLPVLAATLGTDQLEELTADALRLLSYGLIGLYSSTQDMTQIREEAARTVLVTRENWLGIGHSPVWFIAATPRGEGFLAAHGLDARN